jgi:hypothetical protein
MEKLLFVMLAASTFVVLPNSSQATPGSMAPGFTNSIVQRQGADDKLPRQEDRQRDRQKDDRL